jgi:D-sedoheptulose 7-phosphate isomerase
MNTTDFKNQINNYLLRLRSTIKELNVEEINSFMNLLVDAKEKGKHIFIMGNGGSASTASHYVCDFNKGLSYGKDKRFKFICLNDNVPTMMAYANDVSYAEVFVEPLKNFLQEDDIVIGISGSGNSKNVIKAIEYANESEAITIALTGFDGGKLKQVARHNVNIPVNDMQITEDLHMVLDHCIMKILYDY